MRIKRAHSYAPIEAIRHELSRLPIQWQKEAQSYQFIVYPDDLSPVWTGLVFEDAKTHDGERLYSSVGGWCASEEYAWFCADTPHIFLSHSSVKATSHEIGHALEELWHVPVDDFFKPEKSFYPYMASNPAEYFACAFEAYLIPEQDDINWNKHDLAKYNLDLFQWLEAKKIEDGEND